MAWGLAGWKGGRGVGSTRGALSTALSGLLPPAPGYLGDPRQASRFLKREIMADEMIETWFVERGTAP